MSRPTLLLMTRLSDRMLSEFSARFDVVPIDSANSSRSIDKVSDRVVAIATSSGGTVDAGLINRLPNLQIIADASVGYDFIDVEEADRRGIVVTNSAGSLDDEVADTAMGLLIMAVRRLPQAERYLRAGKWPQAPFPLSPSSLRGRKMGIVGMGRIGEKIAARAETFGMEIAYHNRAMKKSTYRYYPTLQEMAFDVDTLMVVVPGGSATKHLIDGTILGALGSDGIVVNVARGSVIDQNALLKALEDGTILAAGLDVFDDEPNVPQALIDCDNAVLLPHVGSASTATRDAMARLCLDNLVSWFGEGIPVTPIPQPE